ncbi:MAG: hypothetical protein B6I35_14605 [Anaerolineaceae bacterium 4572_32.2]|nr:MAG: hypothetical protein B6I35_14605 [Anaerolineaceae bacterium 4572_32.2]
MEESMRQIKITVASVAAIADLEDNSTADAIWETLPLTGRANTWGDEIYFEIPVFLETAAGAREVVAVGELGYWPAGHAFCIFFGRTPASRGSEPRAASAVNVFGRIAGDATILRQVESGEIVFVERIE